MYTYLPYVTLFTGSRVACTLNDLEEWREYKMEVLRQEKKTKTFLEKKFKKVTTLTRVKNLYIKNLSY